MGNYKLMVDKIRFDGPFCRDTCPFLFERTQTCSLCSVKLNQGSWFSFARCSMCINLCELYSVTIDET